MHTRPGRRRSCDQRDHETPVADGTGTAHHVIDPATGLPAKHSAASTTVIATRAVDAETLATAALLAGPDAGVELLSAHGASGVLVGRDGERHATTELIELVA